MKRLTHWLNHQFQDQPHWNWIDAPEAAAEGESSVLDLLKKPHLLTLTDLRKIERSRDELSAAEIQKLNELAEYQLSLVSADKKSENYPSRIIFELFHSKLFGNLKPRLQTGIRFMLSKEQEALKQYSQKDPKEWTDGELSRVMRIFRYMRTRGTQAFSSNDNEAFQQLNTSLTQKVHELLERYQLNQRTKENESFFSNNKLKTSERLFLLEMYRIFPNSSDWAERGGEPTYHQLRKATTGTTWQVIKNLQDYTPEEGEVTEEPLKPVQRSEETTGDFNQRMADYQAQLAKYKEYLAKRRRVESERIEFLPHWEIIQELVEDRNILADIGENLTPEQLERIQNFTDSCNKAQFLIWIKEWKKQNPDLVLLPSHLQVLNQIQSEEFMVRQGIAKKNGRDEIYDEMITQWEADHGDIELEEETDQKNEKGEAILKKIKLKDEMARLRSAINDDKKLADREARKADYLNSDQYRAALPYLEPETKQLFDYFYSSEIAEHGFRTNVDGFPDESGIEQTEFKRLDRHKLLLKKIKSALEEKIQELKDAATSLPADASAEDRRAHTAEANKREALQSLLPQVNDLLETPFSKEFSEKISENEKRINDLKDRAAKEQNSLRQQIQYAKTLEVAPDDALELLNDYNERLKNRLESHTLQAADMAVIMEAREDETLRGLISDTKYGGKDRFFGEAPDDQVFQKICDFRQHLETALNHPEFDLVLGEIDETVSEDRFRPWTDAIEAQFGYDKIFEYVASGENAELTRIFRELTDVNQQRLDSRIPPMSAKALIDAAVHNSRDLVRNKINHALRQTSAGDHIKRQFMAEYEPSRGMLGELHIEKPTEDVNHHQDYIERREENARIADKILNKSREVLEDWDRSRIERLIEDRGSVNSPREVFDEIDRRYQHAQSRAGKDFVFFSETDKAAVAQNFPHLQPEQRSRFANEILEKFTLMKAQEMDQSMLNEELNRIVYGAENELGKDDLNTLFLQIQPFVNDLDKVRRSFLDKHQLLIKQFENERTMSAATMDYEYFREIDEHFIPQLEKIREAIKAMGQSLFPEEKYQQFMNQYLGMFDGAISHLKHISESTRTGHGQGDWSKNHIPQLKLVEDAFSQTMTDLNPKKGDLANLEAYLENRLNALPDTTRALKEEHNLFMPGKEQEFVATQEQARAKWMAEMAEYERTSLRGEGMLERDLNSMSEEAFQKKHEMSREQGMEVLEQMRDNRKTFADATKPFASPGYFNQWLDRYKDPNQRMQALHDFNLWQELQKNFDNLQEQRVGLTEFATAYKNHGLKNAWHCRIYRALPRLSWENSFSILDLWKMLEQTGEIIKRRYERQREQASAKLGSAIWGDTAWGREFNRLDNEAEEKRVKDYETQWNEKEWWEWEKRLGETKDKDELRALIKLLVDNGYMRWDNPKLMLQLMKFQDQVFFVLPQDAQKEIAEIEGKIETACSAIWSNTVFSEWSTSLQGNIKKGIEGKRRKFDIESTKTVDGGLKGWFQRCLTGWERGDGDVDPIEFESFIRYAFEIGKANGSPDVRFAYLVLGLSVKNPDGKTLLGRDMFQRLQEQLGNMPAFEFLVDPVCWKKDGRIVPEGTPGAHKGLWNTQDVQGWHDICMKGASGYADLDKIAENSMRFLLQNIFASEMTKVRCSKMQRKAADIDHDDAWFLLAALDKEGMQQVFNRKSEGADIASIDSAMGFSSGFIPYLIYRYEGIIKQDEIYGAENPNWKPERDKVLREIGDKIRVAFTQINMLAGNVHMAGAQSPMVADASRWQENSYDIQDNKKMIDDSVIKLMNYAGKDNVSTNFDGYIGMINSTSDFAQRKNDKKYKAVSDNITKIVDDESLFSNETAIERFMQEFYNANAGKAIKRGSENIFSGSGSSDLAGGFAQAA